MTEAMPASELQGVAVIGMAGRFPQAPDIDALWRLLCEGREGLSRFDDAQLRKAGVPSALSSDPHYVPVNGAVADIESFDASFFGMSPREASLTDPQHRMFLELCWHALEHSGNDPARFSGAVGVYAGCGASSYLLHNLLPNRAMLAELGELPIRMGNGAEYLATRVSFKLGLTGPSVNVNTACSTSLVAVHLACAALQGFECDMALAGGVSIQLPQEQGYLHTLGGILSPDGHCRAFDAAAQGTVSGNGGAVVVLKRLADAIADGDTVYAVIRGSAINNDGGEKAGYTAPSLTGQAQVIAEALAVADVCADTIDYVETHGTGTPLGDPIELAALTRVFRQQAAAIGRCAIGSVKTNLGHLDEAAGVTGLIKTVLALRHRRIPPSLHFATANPEIDLAASPFHVNAELRVWPAAPCGRPRRAAVSSFGIGGTNAHVVLEEAPARFAARPTRPIQLLPYSARSAAALGHCRSNLAAWLADPQQELADVAYTLQVGRRGFAYRDYVLGADTQGAALALASVGASDRRPAADPPPIVFLFSGQGSQHPRMAQPLYEGEAVFRRSLDACAERLLAILGMDLRPLLFPSSAADEHAAEFQLQQTALAQPALFSVEYALAELWRHWGVEPTALIGHSIGEYVAACVAGVMELDTALALVAERGRLMQAAPPGAMLAVPLGSAELARHLADDVEIAAINAADRCVVAGAAAAVDALAARLRQAGVESQPLNVSHAFHSRAMDSIRDDFRGAFDRHRLHAPRLPYISNVSGDWIDAAEACDPAYYVRHLRQSVEFSRGVARVLQDHPRAILLEVGPGAALTQAVRRTAPAATQCLASLPSRRDAAESYRVLLGSLGCLWQSGAAVDWAHFAEPGRSRVALPGYAFERQRHWIEPAEGDFGDLAVRSDLAATKTSDIDGWFYVPSWTRSPRRQIEMVERFIAAGDGERADLWLFFLDRDGIGAAIVERFRRQQRNVVTVSPGPAFAQTGPASYHLPPGEPADFVALVAALAHAGRRPRHIVHLWSLTQPPESDEAVFNQVQMMGFYSLLALAKALAAQGGAGPIAVTVVANGVHDISDDDASCAAKATVMGPLQVIQQEFPALSCRCIDLPADLADAQRDPCLRQLAAELLSDVGDRVIALRGSHRWTQGFDAARAPARANNPPRRLRHAGAYLIVGGLGKIGLLLADYLAETVRARLVLIGRSPFPDKSGWDAWLVAHAADNAVSRRILRLRALEAAGADVLVLQADVADEAQMALVVARAEERFQRIDGVFHAAGVASEKSCIPIEELDVTSCERELNVKARGVLVLERLFRERAPDFVLLFSSLASVLGGLGFAAYSAANHFIDAVARSRNRCDGPAWISVNWDGWLLDDAGAARRGPTAGDRALGITPDEGREAFRRLFDRPETGQIVVSTADLQARLRRWVTITPAATAEQPEPVAGAGGPALHQRPPLANPYVAPRNATEQQLAALWQGLLGIDGIGVQDDFFALNGDSLLAIQLIAKANRSLDGSLTLRDLFDAPTIAGLAERLHVQSDSSAHAIAPTPPQPDYALSHAQRRLWILAQNPAASVAYNMSYCLRLHGTVNRQALRSAFGIVVQRHESLRTAFIIVGGRPRQRIQPAEPFVLPFTELWQEADPLAAARELVGDEAVTAFRLDRPPLLRAHLVRVAEYEHLLLVSLHHIVGDGLSFNVLMRELNGAYAAFCVGRTPNLPPLPIQYKDFAEWQQRLHDDPSMEACRTYWLEKLGGELPLLALTTDRPRPPFPSFAGGQLLLRLPVSERDLLLQRCRDHGVSLFVLLVAALKVLLHKASGQDDILVGAPVAGRERAELEGQIGHYLNTVVLRDTIRRDEPFTELLQRVRDTVTGALAHQSYPFDKLIEDLSVVPEPGRSPLFDVLINLMPSESLSLQLGDLTVDGYPGWNDTTLFELNFMFSNGPPGLALELAYSTDLFEVATVTELGERLMRLLTEIGKRPETTVRALCSLFDRAEAMADKAAFLAASLQLNEEF
jgi:acyl transferase domain-containing protein